MNCIHKFNILYFLCKHFGGLTKQKYLQVINYHGASLVAQMTKNLLEVWETQVQSLGLEDPLEKDMATHSNILAWKIPQMEEPGRLQSMRLQRVRHD